MSARSYPRPKVPEGITSTAGLEHRMVLTTFDGWQGSKGVEMDITKERLNYLWLNESTLPVHPDPNKGRFVKQIGVTSREPMFISGRMLLPGRYVFRLMDPGAESDHIEFFNEDHTKLVAEISPVLDS